MPASAAAEPARWRKRRRASALDPPRRMGGSSPYGTRGPTRRFDEPNPNTVRCGTARAEIGGRCQPMTCRLAFSGPAWGRGAEPVTCRRWPGDSSALPWAVCPSAAQEVRSSAERCNSRKRGRRATPSRSSASCEPEKERSQLAKAADRLREVLWRTRVSNRTRPLATLEGRLFLPQPPSLNARQVRGSVSPRG